MGCSCYCRLKMTHLAAMPGSVLGTAQPTPGVHGNRTVSDKCQAKMGHSRCESKKAEPMKSLTAKLRVQRVPKECVLQPTNPLQCSANLTPTTTTLQFTDQTESTHPGLNKASALALQHHSLSQAARGAATPWERGYSRLGTT